MGSQLKDWIESEVCPWPKAVKEQALFVIEKQNELRALQKVFVKIPMLSPAKVNFTQAVAEVTRELSNAYSNLSKELAFHRSMSTLHITQGNKPGGKNDSRTEEETIEGNEG